MASVLKSGTAITFPVVASEGGFPESAFSVSKAVSIGGVTVWEDPAKQDWQDAIDNRVQFPGAASVVVGSQQAFALFQISAWDEAGELLARVDNEVIIEASDLLRPLVNSFGTWGELTLKAHQRVDLRDYGWAPDDQKKAALIQAYHNIGDVHVDFCPPRRRARWMNQSRMWDDTGIFESDIERIWSTRMLTDVTWGQLRSDIHERLVTAQLIEANFLLSGRTPEKQRLSGLLSHSAGESTHFYRTTKPLELPVCRATALALKGIISYVVRISG